MSNLIPVQDNDGARAVMGRDLHAFLEVKEKAEEEAQLMSQRLQVVEGTTGIIPGTFWTLADGAKGKNIFIRKLRQMGFLYKQSQRLTMQG